MKRRLLTIFTALTVFLTMLAGLNVAPVYALGDSNMVVSAGWSDTFVIKSDGSLWGWGVNSQGTVGNGTKEVVLKPVKVLDDVVSVSSYSHHTVAVKKDGTLWGWGSNRYGALGKTSEETVLKPVKLMDDVRMASAGRYCTVVVKNDNTLWIAGQNGLGDGKLGDPKAGFRKAMDKVQFAAAGEDVIFAIKEDGSLWGWGFNEFGQIGNGTRTGDNNLTGGGKLVLTAVKVLDGVSYVASTRSTTMAIRGDGSLWMWGGPNQTKFYTINGIVQSAPASPIKVMENVRQASLSVEGTTYAVVKGDGTVWGWGDSVALRGTVGTIDQPVKLYDNARLTSLGNRHLAVVKNDNTLWMAGSNYYGPLGFGERSGDRPLKQLLTDVMYGINGKTAVRLGGSNRYDTSVAIAQEGWEKSDYAVLATGNNFPDALAAAPLAKKYDAPILLTDKSGLPANVVAELKRLQVKNVFIMGGTGAVPLSIENQIKQMGITTERLGGADRFETAVKIAEKLAPTSGELILSNGFEFADALSASSIAAKKGMPILLTDSQKLPASVANYLDKSSFTKSYVIGNTGLISEAVASSLPNHQRITGNNKYERNINIIKCFEDEIDFSNVCIATGRDFPDALAGSAFATLVSSAIVLVDDKDIKDVTANYTSEKFQQIENVYIFGLQGAVNDEALYQMIKGK